MEKDDLNYSIAIIAQNYDFRYKELVKSGSTNRDETISSFEKKTRQVIEILQNSCLKTNNIAAGVPELMNFAKYGDDWSNKDPKFLFNSQNSLTLNGVFLKQYLKKHGFNSIVIDNFQCEKTKLEQELKKGLRYLIISTTFITDTLPILEICDFAKKINPNVITIVGGPLIYQIFSSSNAAWQMNVKRIISVLKSKVNIFICERKGEKTLVKLIDHLIKGYGIDSVPNLVYYDAEGELVNTEKVLEDGSIDDISVDYSSIENIEEKRYLSLITSRGCVFKCKFCTYHESFPKVELKSIETLESEIDSIPRSNYKRMIRLADDNFAISASRLRKFCELLIRKDYNFNWSCFASHHSMMDPDNVKLMASSGCKLVFIGIESANDKILKMMNKKVTVSDFYKVIENLNRYGITAIGSFVIGFPGEDEETIQNNIKFINESGMEYYQLNLLNIMPSMEIYKERYEHRLKGFMYGWEHSTMDSVTAAQAMVHIVKSVDGAVTGGIGDSSVQGTLEYLYSEGFSKEDIHTLFRLYTDLLKENLSCTNTGFKVQNSDTYKQFKAHFDKICSLN